MQKPQSDYEAHHSGGLWINPDHLGNFDHLNISTQAFLHSAAIAMQLLSSRCNGELGSVTS